jgi:hypothetical protein
MPNQDEKGSLVGIFGVLLMAENLLADTPHQPPVSLDEQGKGGLITVADKALEQLGVAKSLQLLSMEPGAELLDCALKLRPGHALEISLRCGPFLDKRPHAADWVWDFVKCGSSNRCTGTGVMMADGKGTA